MGIVKTELSNLDERGWRDPKTYVCRKCIGNDAYLKKLIHQNFCDDICSYCSCKRRKAAPVAVLMDALLRGVKYSYNDEANAGCSYDREVEIKYQNSEYVLYQVLESDGIEWCENLVSDVASAFVNTGWVDAPDGEWMGSFLHQRLNWSWASFANVVKHRSRFHFHAGKQVPRWGEDVVSAHEMLPFLGQLIRRYRHCMLSTLSPSDVFYRIRVGSYDHSFNNLGPPPPNIASAGRMNPAGIPYLYLALDKLTAQNETRPKSGEKITLSRWKPSRELNVIDLTSLPSPPSIFSEKRTSYDMVQFLYAFTSEIAKPIARDSDEHIDYVPTQVVSEYFAQSFRIGKTRRVDGLIYESSVSPQGKNLVVFPNYDANVCPFESMSLLDSFVEQSV